MGVDAIAARLAALFRRHRQSAVTVGELVSSARTWAADSRLVVDVDPSAEHVAIPGDPVEAKVSLRCFLAAARRYGAAEITLTVTAVDSRVIVVVVDDGSRRPDIERVLSVAGGAGTELVYHHEGRNVSVLEYVVAGARRPRPVYVTPRRVGSAVSSALPRAAREPPDRPD